MELATLENVNNTLPYTVNDIYCKTTWSIAMLNSYITNKSWQK